MNLGFPVFEHAHHHGHPFFWFVALLVFLALIAVAICTLVRLTRGSGSSAGAPAAAAAEDGAIESVRMRYARGEIQRDEFIRVSTDLGAPPPAPAA